jgi:precorrin isomerase
VYLDNLKFSTSTTNTYKVPRVAYFNYEKLNMLIMMDKRTSAKQNGDKFGKLQISDQLLQKGFDVICDFHCVFTAITYDSQLKNEKETYYATAKIHTRMEKGKNTETQTSSRNNEVPGNVQSCF